jgi:type I restriction enzyme S subunit
MRTGAQQPHINKEIVDESLILIPNENSNLLNEYNLKVGSTYEQIINNALQNQQLASLRDWLLPMLMNGQVTVGAKEKVSYEIKEGMDVAAEREGEN